MKYVTLFKSTVFSLGFFGLGFSSTILAEDINVNLTVDSAVAITGTLPVITLPTATPGGADVNSGDQNICVFANTSNNLYNLTLNSTDGSGVEFAMSDGTYAIPYTVDWTDANSNITQGVASGATNSGIVGSSQYDCTTGGIHSKLKINVLAADINVAPSGSAYNDVLEITVEPNLS